MNIGFDAKRAYHNKTGLGHYSRSLIRALAGSFPQHEYYLFNPKPSLHYDFAEKNIHEAFPNQFPSTLFRSAWRSSWVTKDLKALKINLYHGLSHEIPVGINKTGIPAVVTIHDLIHERFPTQYNPIDVRIYKQKYRYACKHAAKVIAISQQTKQDIIDYYKIAADKIEVCYQGCSPLFGEKISGEKRHRIALKYKLPERFFLSVGTINERKNLLNVCKALFLLRNDLDLPLVVIGKGSGAYHKKVMDFVLQNGLQNKIIFLSEMAAAKTDSSFLATEDLPAIYQLAEAMIYPSFFEGFGIPVLEALWSGLPVITSNQSSLPEVGGDAALYINPNSAEEIATAMKKIAGDKQLAEAMREKGWQHAQNFTPEKSAAAVMDVYKKLW